MKTSQRLLILNANVSLVKHDLKENPGAAADKNLVSYDLASRFAKEADTLQDRLEKAERQLRAMRDSGGGVEALRAEVDSLKRNNALLEVNLASAEQKAKDRCVSKIVFGERLHRTGDMILAYLERVANRCRQGDPMTSNGRERLPLLCPGAWTDEALSVSHPGFTRYNAEPVRARQELAEVIDEARELLDDLKEFTA